MRKKLFVTFLSLFTCVQISSAHKQHVHEYIVREAYALLKSRIGEIPTIANHITTNEGGGGGTWMSGLTTAGAWNEDEDDIVYGYSIANPPDVTGPGDEILDLATINDIFGYIKPDPFVSSTHFWEGDQGDDAKTNLEGTLSGIHFKFTVPNANQKIMSYAYGGWLLVYNLAPYLLVTKPNGDILQLIPGTPYPVFLSYSSITDVYKTKRLSTDNLMFTSYKMYNVTKGTYEYYKGDVILSDEWRDRFVWEILGRMCHLLGDMSVPAHAHGDEHGSSPDSYEDWMGGGDHSYYQYWNAQNVQGTYGEFMDPYVSTNPLHYLTYTMQQISDHFGSNGPINGDGNDVAGGNPLPEETSYFNSHPLSLLGGPTTTNGPFDTANLTIIRDATFPYVIRATAGLLYWFGRETGLITPFSVDVSAAYEFDGTENLSHLDCPGGSLSVSAPSSLSKNGRQYVFTGWSDGVMDNPRKVYSASTLTAKYKAHLASDLSTVTASNNQRKITSYINPVNYSTNYYLVYESMGNIYFSSSSDGGWTWSNETMISGGTGTSHNASISQNEGANYPGIFAFWVDNANGAGGYSVYAREFDFNSMTWQNILQVGGDPFTTGLAMSFTRPSGVALSNGFAVAFEDASGGIDVIQYNTNNPSFWSFGGVGSSSAHNPAMVYDGGLVYLTYSYYDILMRYWNVTQSPQLPSFSGAYTVSNQGYSDTNDNSNVAVDGGGRVQIVYRAFDHSIYHMYAIFQKSFKWSNGSPVWSSTSEFLGTQPDCPTVAGHYGTDNGATFLMHNNDPSSTIYKGTSTDGVY